MTRANVCTRSHALAPQAYAKGKHTIYQLQKALTRGEPISMHVSTAYKTADPFQ